MASSTTLNVSLPPELDGFIRDRLSNGRYATPSDMVREGLHLLQQQEHEADLALGLFKAKIKRACDQADRGEVVDGDAVLAKANALINQRRLGNDVIAK